MGNINCNVRDIERADRQALENPLGLPLRDSQQLVIGIVELNAAAAPADSDRANGGQALPEWCNVYAGLSDEEISDIEQTILTRADLSSVPE